MSALWLGGATAVVLLLANAVAERFEWRVREWSPLLALAALGGGAVGAFAYDTSFGLFFAIGLVFGFALSQPLVLALLGMDEWRRRKRGEGPLERTPPSRIFGQRIAYLRPGVMFRPEPLWTRFPFLADRIVVGDALVEVERGRGSSARELLELDPASYARGGTRWHVVYETGDPTWPALVVHDGALERRVVARTTSVELAEKLAFLLTATYNERHRLMKSPRYWFRTPL